MRTSNSSNCDLNDVCSLFDYAVLKIFFLGIETSAKSHSRSKLQVANPQRKKYCCCCEVTKWANFFPPQYASSRKLPRNNTHKALNVKLPIYNLVCQPSLISLLGDHFCFSLPEKDRALFTFTPPNNLPLRPVNDS